MAARHNGYDGCENDINNLLQRLSQSSGGSSGFDLGEMAANDSPSQSTSQPTGQPAPGYPSALAEPRGRSGSGVNSIQKTLKRFVSSLTSGPGERKMTKKERNEIVAGVSVGPLPQRFLVKYVGNRSCEGLWGSKVVRVPVDLMVRDLRGMPPEDDLPLVNVKIQEDGFKVSLHPKSRSSKKVKDVGFIPLEFISYAVQDSRYSKLFVFVLVRELSSKGRVTECHAYLCDNIVTCRKMALSVANAFRILAAGSKDGGHKFGVDLKAALEEMTEI